MTTELNRNSRPKMIGKKIKNSSLCHTTSQTVSHTASRQSCDNLRCGYYNAPSSLPLPAFAGFVSQQPDAWLLHPLSSDNKAINSKNTYKLKSNNTHAHTHARTHTYTINSFIDVFNDTTMSTYALAVVRTKCLPRAGTDAWCDKVGTSSLTHTHTVSQTVKQGSYNQQLTRPRAHSCPRTK